MELILLIDAMGQRYGILPSDILARGDSIDVGIMVKSMEWHNERERRAKEGQTMPNNFGHTTEQLQAMLARARGE